MNAVLFAPHSDDESLFAAYTVIRHQPMIVICFPSVRDYGDTDVRLVESKKAAAILGGGTVQQWDGGDLVAQMRALDKQLHPERVFAPHREASHPDHVAVADAATAVFGDRVTRYHTYDAGGRVTGRPVPVEPGWRELKQRALACYRTQIEHPRAGAFIERLMADLDEYDDSVPPSATAFGRSMIITREQLGLNKPLMPAAAAVASAMSTAPAESVAEAPAAEASEPSTAEVSAPPVEAATAPAVEEPRVTAPVEPPTPARRPRKKS